MFKGYYVHSAVRRLVVAALVAMCAFATGVSAQQLIPQSPRLSLTGSEGGYNPSWYPDGRLWVTAAGDNGPTEIIVPVFMKNCWQSRTPYTVQPIYSFNFKLQYDSTALKPVGVMTRGPWLQGQHPNVVLSKTDSAALTDGWQITWDDAIDSTYQVQNGLISPSNPNRLRGKRVRIAGQSGRPLPTTGSSSDCNQYEYRPFVYVKFQVLGRPGLGVSDVSPLIVTTDSIYYNNQNVYTQSPFPGDANYPQPQPLDRIIAGVDYTRIGIEPAAVNTITKGMIYMHIRDQFAFDFLPQPTGNPNETSVQKVSDTLFTLTRVIPFDPVLQQGLGQAINEIQVTLTPDGVRATNIIVESDQPWLLFKTRGAKNPIPAPTRLGRIAYIDRGILGPPNGLGYPDAQNAPFPNAIDPKLNFDIICDPGQLADNPDPSNPDEYAGRYEGYITFRSLTAQFTPVRLKVVFLVVRTPNETYNGVPPQDYLAKGMWINVRNSAPVPQSANLMFGTGLRATYHADSLFGEFAYPSVDSSSFFARFFQIPNAKDTSNSDIQAQLYGYGDITQVFDSRDIRDVFEDTTLVYRCRFSAGSALNYPVVLTWDRNQFPDGAQLFLRDIENGKLFGLDMRQATPVPGSGTLMSYTIRDQKITAFDIEYTPARARIQQNFKKGWNLVSLPVRPSSSDYKVIWPNVPSSPIKYSISYYQPEANAVVGYGYFLKFPKADTTIISGLLVKRIAKDVYPVHLYDGWNTVGALSVPVGTEQIKYDAAASNLPPPQQISGVFGYTTDRGYREVSELTPGIGYWVKMAGEGYYNVSAPVTKGAALTNDRDAILNASARISIQDAASHQNSLYVTEGCVQFTTNRFDLPPAPPSADLFDARFSSNTYVSTSETPVIRLQGVEYPVSLSMNNNRSTYTVVDAQSGEVLGTLSQGNSRVVINDERTTAIRLLSETSNNLNYAFTAAPNPTSSKTTVSFSLPETQMVSVKLYNAMGQEIRTLANGVFTKGDSAVELDATDLVSGSYLVKIVANDFVATKAINVVR